MKITRMAKFGALVLGLALAGHGEKLAHGQQSGSTIGGGPPPGATNIRIGHTATFAFKLVNPAGLPPAMCPGPQNLPTNMCMQHYVTAPNGGGPAFAGPNNGPTAVALHVDTQKAGSWEQFTIVPQSSGAFVLETSAGYMVTFVNDGGIGGPNNGAAPIHTDATSIGPDEQFTITGDWNTVTGMWTNATIKTRTGYYLTAVNAGGVGTPAASAGAVVYTNKPYTTSAVTKAEAVYMVPQ